MIVNGDSITEHEKLLLSLGDVVDVDQLRDIPALRMRQGQVSILGRHRLQKQIDALARATESAAHAINKAKS